MAIKYNINRDPAYKLDENEKGYRIRVDGRGHLFVTKDNRIMYPTATFIDDNEIRCTVQERGCKTEVKQKLPYPIKIHESQGLLSKIADSFYISKKQKKPTPLAEQIFAFVRKVYKRNYERLELAVFENIVNQMRYGTHEEQTVFHKFKKHLIDNGFMPVDENNRAYDLSKMHIPYFNEHDFIDTAMHKNPDLLDFTLTFYQKYVDMGYIDENFSACMDRLKDEHPAKFIELYHFLRKNHLIVTEINLTQDQFNFVQEYDAVASAGELKDPVMPYIIEFVKRHVVLPTDIDTVNKTIEKMQQGTFEEQAAYHMFCTMIQDLNNTIFLEDLPQQSASEERKKLIKKAVAKSKATLDMRV